MTINLKEFALKSLETAEQDLRRDKYLIPVAFIVTDTEVHDYTLDFADAEQKASVYRELVEIAKQMSAHAIITINDANVTDDFQTTSQAGSDGEAAQRRVRECIYLTVSGPAIRTWTICAPYDRKEDEIIFGVPSETTNDFLNLLSGWPTDQQNVS
jgi:hypothetical protein